MDDSFQSDYTFAPRTSLPDLRLVGIAAGVVVVILALIVVGVEWISSNMREETWV